MLDSSRCAPATTRPAGTQPLRHSLTTTEAAVIARMIAPISSITIDDGWRDDDACTDALHLMDPLPPRRRAANVQTRRPVSITEYRRALVACPACGARLTGNDICRSCDEQWWRCADLARAVGLPRGYLTGLIAIGWLPAVQTASGAWLRQRDAERVIAGFAAMPAALSAATRTRRQDTPRLALVPTTELPDG